MEQASKDESAGSARLRIAVIGNSNSVMRDSYVRTLEKNPRLAVANHSIGSSPNVVLLDFLAIDTDLNYDFIIIETAVVDLIQENSLYTRERSEETLELFISSVKSRSRAQIIILMIPTRFGLLEPGMHWQEPLYQGIAARFGIPHLNGFALMRQLLGPSKAAVANVFRKRAEQLVSAFGLPNHLIPPIAWRSMRNHHIMSNSLGFYGFKDSTHFASATHALAGRLLENLIQLSATTSSKSSDESATAAPLPVIISDPVGTQRVVRQSSLITREVTIIQENSKILYLCPPGYRAYGILINQVKTNSFVRLDSPAGSAVFDMRFRPLAVDWVAIVVPILNPVGDGIIEVTISNEPPPGGVISLHSTESTTMPPAAEVGEILLVRTDWRETLDASTPLNSTCVDISGAAWARQMIEEAAEATNRNIAGVEEAGHFVDNQCYDYAAAVLAQGTAITAVQQAQLMLLMGMTDQLPRFVDASLAHMPEDIEIRRMAAVFQTLRAEERVPHRELLDRALALIRSGAAKEADTILALGMARFPQEISFPIQRAWISHHGRNWPEAIDRWQLVKDCFPEHSVGYMGLSMGFHEARRLEEAENTLVSAMSRFPDLVELAALHARLAHERNDLLEAVGRLSAVRSRFPHHKPSRWMLVELLTKQGQLDQARIEVAGMLRDGVEGQEFLTWAIRLVTDATDLDWLKSVWAFLVAGVPDRQRTCHEAEILLTRYCKTYDCAFLLVWLLAEPWADRISQMPLIVGVISRSRGNATSRYVTDIVTHHIDMITDVFLQRVVKSQLQLHADAAAYGILLSDILGRAQEDDLPGNLLITLLSPGSITLALMDAVKVELRSLIEAPALLPHGADIRIYLLLLVGDVLFPEQAKKLLARLARERTGNSRMDSVSEILATMAQRHREPLINQVISRSRLKICFCVSGQLRGYEAALQTWRTQGLFDHDVTTIVHVWRSLGLKEPDNIVSASRAFSGTFLAEYQNILQARGWSYIREQFPALISSLIKSNTPSDSDLELFYSASAVVTEDESQPEFRSKSNFWKMYYKVRQAHLLGRKLCPDADLYVRARPDQDMTVFERFDWLNIHRETSQRSVIFTDSGRFFAPPYIWMDDRLAIGSAKTMDAYAAAFDHVAEAAAGRLPGYPTDYLPHSCFAYTTLYHSIGAERLPQTGPFKLLNPPRIASTLIEKALRADIARRTETSADVRLLQAVIADIG